MELTKREIEVLALLASGMTNAQIAVRLGKSEQTIKNHLSGTTDAAGIYRKIGARNRVEAALWARDHPEMR